MSELGPLDGGKMRQIEVLARDIGHIVGGAIKQQSPGTGFALLIFSFAGPEFTYISNADRASMIKLFEEVLARWKDGEADQLWAERS